MINTNAFDYINLLDKAADAAWLRHEAISNNISNVDTPGYKRQDVAFASYLERELSSDRHLSIDERVHNLDLKKLNGQVYIDYANYTYRLDGNNVDPENENVYMAENQLKYQGLMNCISQEFQNLQSVMK
ncbi:MAG: flagellar basal body rod protein FlgB [Acetatifactor sp.]|nr:flagellar basal body rod protein FlgB [Acetatifactor sp.]